MRLSCCILRSLSLKKCRQLIAKDMGLPENGLDGEKKYVLELIDEVITTLLSMSEHCPGDNSVTGLFLLQIVTRVANNAAGPTPTKQKAAPAVKRKKTDHSDEGKDRQRTGAVKGGSNQAGVPLVCWPALQINATAWWLPYYFGMMQRPLTGPLWTS